jgi:hypothetical protein
VALGTLSLSKSEFGLMTPRELELAYNGYRSRVKEQWEMVRITAYYSMAPHYKNLTLSKVQLPIDEKPHFDPKKHKLVKITKIDA